MTSFYLQAPNTRGYLSRAVPVERVGSNRVCPPGTRVMDERGQSLLVRVPVPVLAAQSKTRQCQSFGRTQVTRVPRRQKGRSLTCPYRVSPVLTVRESRNDWYPEDWYADALWTTFFFGGAPLSPGFGQEGVCGRVWLGWVSCSLFPI